MEPFRYHVFICDQCKPEGIPACSARGSGAVIDKLRSEIAHRGLIDNIQVTVCGSLGLCEHGPNLVVYPEGVWYSGVQPDDVPEIIESHFQNGNVFERLARTDPAELRSEMLLNRSKMQAALNRRDASGALPDDLTQTIRAFQESRVMLTAVELDVFTAVGGGAKAHEVASRARTDVRATELLLNALAAMGLLTKQGDCFRNTPVTARYLIEGAPDDARASLMHTVNLWSRWSTLTDAVRTGTAVGHREMADRGEDWTRSFIAAMDRNAAERAPVVVQAAGAAGVAKMLDVGGGSGAYSIAFARANEKLRAEVLDLASVIPIAEEHISKAGLSGRVKVRAGDLRKDALGEGYDLLFVSAICHMLGPEENRDLLSRCSKALVPGGRLILQDFILEADKTSPKTGVLFALNMLVGTQRGESYSKEEYTNWLQVTGFEDVRHIRLPGPTSLMTARKP